MIACGENEGVSAAFDACYNAGTVAYAAHLAGAGNANDIAGAENAAMTA
jgi:hypothetical protein